MSDDRQATHVFISYVNEDRKEVDRLCDDLTRQGVKVWLDRRDIEPGMRWRDAIREAIQQGDFFIACFSKAYSSRRMNQELNTHMNEELTLAIGLIRQRQRAQTWFIPVLLSGEVPDWDIGAGENLRDFQWIDLRQDWDAGIQRIVDVVQANS